MKWDYLVCVLDERNGAEITVTNAGYDRLWRKTLTQMGEEGWELCSAYPEVGATTYPAKVYIFKRPKES